VPNAPAPSPARAARAARAARDGARAGRSDRAGASSERSNVVSLDGPARSSRRDDQRRETKRRLVAAAIALIGEVGWKRTTVEQIAERAGVAKGTFFVHFKTKEAIVVTLVQLQIGAASAAREAVVARGGSVIERLDVATMTLGVQAAANVELSRAVLVASLESREVGSATDAVFGRLFARMADDAREGIESGVLRGPDPETVASLLMASYLGATLHCASSPHAKPLAEVLRPLVDATLAALTTPPTARSSPSRSSPSRSSPSRSTPSRSPKTRKPTTSRGAT
jgi:AcrR family transcriptional regulator